MICVDGGPDDNFRFPKSLDLGIEKFKDYFLLISTHTLGNSAFRFVERRKPLFSLSKELAGVVLPQSSFGNHLDELRQTTDERLKRQNFQ